MTYRAAIGTHTANKTNDSYSTDRIRSIDFKAEHLKQIETDRRLYKDLNDLDGEGMVHEGLSYTIVDKDDVIIAIFGVMTEEHVAVSWLVLSTHFLRHAREVTDCINHFIEVLPSRGDYRVIIGSVAKDFKLGQKWIQESLGFTPLDRAFAVKDNVIFLYERKLNV